MATAPEREHAVERLITFADAVVAIAITLLAIPLIDLRPHDAGFAAFLDAAGGPLRGFVISFFVIAQLWWAHHRVYEHVERWNGALVRLTLVWLFLVVLLSAVTATTTRTDPAEEPWSFVVYMAVMIASSLLLLLQSMVVRRHPELTDGADDRALLRDVTSIETLVGLLIALLIGVLVPVVSYWALFVLLLTGRFDGLIVRRLERRRSR